MQRLEAGVRLSRALDEGPKEGSRHHDVHVDDGAGCKVNLAAALLVLVLKIYYHYYSFLFSFSNRGNQNFGFKNKRDANANKGIKRNSGLKNETFPKIFSGQLG